MQFEHEPCVLAWLETEAWPALCRTPLAELRFWFSSDAFCRYVLDLLGQEQHFATPGEEEDAAPACRQADPENGANDDNALYRLLTALLPASYGNYLAILFGMESVDARENGYTPFGASTFRELGDSEVLAQAPYARARSRIEALDSLLADSTTLSLLFSSLASHIQSSFSPDAGRGMNAVEQEAQSTQSLVTGSIDRLARARSRREKIGQALQVAESEVYTETSNLKEFRGNLKVRLGDLEKQIGELEALEKARAAIAKASGKGAHASTLAGDNENSVDPPSVTLTRGPSGEGDRDDTGADASPIPSPSRLRGPRNIPTETMEELRDRKASVSSLLYLIDEELQRATVDDALAAGKPGSRPQGREEMQRKAIANKLITDLSSRNRWLTQRVQDAEKEIRVLNGLLADSRERLATTELKLGQLRQDKINATQELEELRMSTLTSPLPDAGTKPPTEASAETPLETPPEVPVETLVEPAEGHEMGISQPSAHGDTQATAHIEELAPQPQSEVGQGLISFSGTPVGTKVTRQPSRLLKEGWADADGGHSVQSGGASTAANTAGSTAGRANSGGIGSLGSAGSAGSVGSLMPLAASVTQHPFPAGDGPRPGTRSVDPAASREGSAAIWRTRDGGLPGNNAPTTGMPSKPFDSLMHSATGLQSQLHESRTTESNLGEELARLKQALERKTSTLLATQATMKKLANDLTALSTRIQLQETEYDELLNRHEFIVLQLSKAKGALIDLVKEDQELTASPSGADLSEQVTSFVRGIRRSAYQLLHQAEEEFLGREFGRTSRSVNGGLSPAQVHTLIENSSEMKGCRRRLAELTRNVSELRTALRDAMLREREADDLSSQLKAECERLRGELQASVPARPRARSGTGRTTYRATERPSGSSGSSGVAETAGLSPRSPRRPGLARQSSGLSPPEFLEAYDPQRYLSQLEERYGLSRMVGEAEKVREAARSRDVSAISSRGSSRAGSRAPSRNASRF